MPPITSFSGEILLESATVEEIKKQADLLLKQKDVAGAWQSAQHIKKELSGLPAERLTVFLTEYRKISANLKALAFSLLEKEEAFNLLEHNLSFVSSEYLPSLALALLSWVDLQEDPVKTREEVIKLLEKAGSAGTVLKASLANSSPVSSAEPVKKVELVPSYEMFNEKERDELLQHANLVNKINPSALTADGASSVVEKIFLSARPSIDQEAFARRAQALIASRLRDVRTPAQLNEYLSRPFTVGGLGLAGESLQEASRLIESEYQKLHAVSSTAKPTTALPVASVPEPVLDATFKALEEKEDLGPGAPPTPKKETPVVPTSTPTPTPKTTSEPISTLVPPIFEKPRTAKPGVAVPQASVVALLQKEVLPNVAQVRNLAGSDKPRVADIKSPSSPTSGAPERTLSPADELKLLTLADWRGWGSAADAASEILRRVGLLSEESLASKRLAIRQFRSSELFKDYVRIGQASLSANKKLAEILSDAAVNPNRMTEDEFFTLTSLNSKLK